MNIVNIQLTDEEKEYIENIAREADLDISSFIKSQLLASISVQDKPILSKYEDDLLTHILNNTILIRYLVDNVGDVEVIEKAKISVKNWKKDNYITE